MIKTKKLTHIMSNTHLINFENTFLDFNEKLNVLDLSISNTTMNSLETISLNYFLYFYQYYLNREIGIDSTCLNKLNKRIAQNTQILSEEKQTIISSDNQIDHLNYGKLFIYHLYMLCLFL